MTVRTERPRVIKSAQDRRRDIMEAAVAVFAGKGVAGATVADITHAAGVAKGTFYLYFDSKEHVVAALRERFVAELTGHAAPFIEAIGRVDWWDLARAVAQDMVDWTLAHRDICAVIMQTYAPETHDIVQEADLSLIRRSGPGCGLPLQRHDLHRPPADPPRRADRPGSPGPHGYRAAPEDPVASIAGRRRRPSPELTTDRQSA